MELDLLAAPADPAQLVVGGVVELAVGDAVVAVQNDVVVGVVDQRARAGAGHGMRLAAGVAVVGRRPGAAAGRDIRLAQDVARQVVAQLLHRARRAAVDRALDPGQTIAHIVLEQLKLVGKPAALVALSQVADCIPDHRHAPGARDSWEPDVEAARNVNRKVP